jgi:hypothetical protein
MDTSLGSLILVQWQQWRRPLAVCTGWILCCVAYAWFYEVSHRMRDPVATFYASCLLYTLFAGVFLAMRIALGERTHGTLGFSLALPASRRTIAGVRLAAGLLTLIVPIVIGAIVMTPLLGSGLLEHAELRGEPLGGPYVRLPERPSLSPAGAVGLLWTVTAVVIACGVEFVLLLSVFGAKRKAESQIAFFGVVAAVGWMLAQGLYDVMNGWVGALLPSSFIILYSYGTLEGDYTDLTFAHSLWLPLLVNLGVLGLLTWWFVERYGTGRAAVAPEKRSAWKLRVPSLLSGLPVPVPNRAAALIWLNLRQSLPLALAGLLLASLIALTTVNSLGNESFRSQLPANMWWVATLWATVVGAGIFAAEVRPDLAAFWRSRPIGVGGWFWIKFAVGLLAVLLVLDGATIAVGWGTPIGHTSGLSWSYIACIPILHAVLYSLAVLGVCWLRRPVAGAMLALVVYFVASAVVPAIGGSFLEPIRIYSALISDEIDGQFNLAGHGYPLVYGTLAAMIIICAVLASRLIRPPELPAGR